MKQVKSIQYLSQGLHKTGGFRHEKVLYESICKYYGATKVKTSFERKKKNYNTVFGHFYLLAWSFFKSNASINIVTSRLALSAVIRNLFNNNEILIVLHNFDPNDGKSLVFKKYFNFLFYALRKMKSKRFKVIAVSSFWKKYFEETIHLPNVYQFSNYYEIEKYQQIQKKDKNLWIHLGQWSTKNDEAIFGLAQKLSLDGFYCYFSTTDSAAAKSNNGSYEIICFHDFKDYLEQVSMSLCTLALPKINEGWNRVAHESMLLSTPVIGYDKGGLGDLMKESHSIIVKNIEEVYICIKDNLFVLPQNDFIQKYDVSNVNLELEKICKTH